jgi:hypothetical protein
MQFRRRLDALKPGLKLAVSMRLEEHAADRARAIRDEGADLILIMNPGRDLAPFLDEFRA